jgi:hypothetical protein
MACSLDYIKSITGDCSNLGVGSFTIDILGSAPDYTIQWISPMTATTALGAGVTSYTESNLTAGTYTFNIIDSCSDPSNNILPVNIYISSGTCLSLVGVENTICGLNNGALTAQTTNLYGVAEFYLYSNTNGFITSGASFSNLFLFNGLSADTYYVVGNDGGGCTGKSETCIIKSSSTLDFGFYVVDDSGCDNCLDVSVQNYGKIFITGLTGNPPYTYLWSNGQTTSSITGLSSGSYSVVVTDSTGCSQAKGVSVEIVPSLSIASFTVDNPTCFSATAEVTITVLGGTPPYYYSASNGTIIISLSNSVTFTGVSTGVYSVQVTDAALCTVVGSTTVLSPGGLSIVSVSTENSLCNNTTGKISIILLGGNSPYTYELTDSLSNSLIQTTNSPSWAFNNLASDTYILTISDSGGVCTYVDTITINNTVLFELSANTTGTTCNQFNGSVELFISTGGTGPYRYELTGQPFADIGDTGYTFTNLASGTYLATVTDLSNLCSQYLSVVVDSSDSINFSLFGLNPTNGLDGEISALITSGEPPFIINWSSNVNGQTGLTVTNLTAGTYTLTVTDDNGCTQTRSIDLIGYQLINSYQTFNICDTNFDNSPILLLTKPRQLLIEGYYDLTSGNTNCVLNQTIFSVETTLSGITKIQEIFTGSTLSEYPSDDLISFYIRLLLSSYEGVSEVQTDVQSNSVNIITICEENPSLLDSNVVVDLKIFYDISCGCSCSEGFEQVGDVCQKLTYTSVTVNTTAYTADAGSTSTSYGDMGGYVYENITNFNFPITAQTNTILNDASGNTLSFVTTGTNPLWGDNSGVNGRLNNIGIWTTNAPAPIGEWIGFAFCIELESEQTYTIGYAVDDRGQIFIDGELIISLESGNNFAPWYLFPITLSAGKHIIELFGYNDGSLASMGAEIYSANTDVISGFTSTTELNPYIVFSTGDYIGETWELGEVSGYSCPSGYSLDTCSSEISCVLIENEGCGCT